jgi:hypothetical protein
MDKTREGRVYVIAIVVLAVLSTLSFDAPGVESLQGAQISYVNGGIGKEEADALHAQAPDYSIELVFVRKVDDREEFLADVHLVITDADGRVVLDRAAQGPIFLARFPDGTYTISAEYHGDTHTRRVAVGGGRHEKIALAWS